MVKYTKYETRGIKMKQTRSAGVLLHITSLPGPFGTGVLGEEAAAFVRQLTEMHFHYWQVLPLCPVDANGSPYCSFSAFAGNLSLIDPRKLQAEGLLTEAEVRENVYDGSVYTAFYSVNGKEWIQAAQADVTLKDIQAGVIACQGVQNMRGMRPGAAAPAVATAQQQAAPVKAAFDWFRIKNR